MNVTTVIKYLLPGAATTNTTIAGPEIVRSTFLLAVLITFPWWPVNATLALTLTSASARGWSRWADDFFMGGRDDFGWEVEPGETNGVD